MEHILGAIRHLKQRMYPSNDALHSICQETLTGAKCNAGCDVHVSPTIAKAAQTLQSKGSHSMSEARLELWKAGRVDVLFQEQRIIQ